MIYQNKYKIVAFVLCAAVIQMACSSYISYYGNKYERPLFYVGHWISFVGWEVIFYDNGSLELLYDPDKRYWDKLTLREWEQLRGFMRSADFENAFTWLQKNDYTPGCCDLEEVTFVIDGLSLGYPICDDQPVPESVRKYISLLEKLLEGKFRERLDFKLPSSACLGETKTVPTTTAAGNYRK